jgi:TolA-binding protein
VGAAALVVMLGKPAPVAEPTPTQVAPVEAPAPQVAVTSPDSTSASVGAEPAAVEPAAAVEAPKAASAPRQVVEATTPAPADSASISREIAAVDQVRTLVSKGQSSAALTALGKYRKEFPRGVLRQEATLLQIEALAKAGNLAAAREIGQRFLREHPRTPHEKRVRALLGDAP